MEINSDLQRDPKLAELADTGRRIGAFAHALTLRDAEGYLVAGDKLKDIQAALREIEDARVRITKPINEGLRAVNAQAQTASAPFVLARDSIKRAMLIYAQEQERLRQAEQAKLDAAAQAERKRLSEIAERAAEQGQENKAEKFSDRAAAVVAPVAQAAAPKIAGISTTTAWTFHVEQPLLVPREYLSVDEVKIRKVVQALKGDAKISGVRVYQEQRIAAGRS